MPEYPDCCFRHRTNGPRGSSCGSLAYTGPEATPDPLATVPAEERPRILDLNRLAVGLYRKFDVRRTDGSSDPGGKHEACEYFVLDWQHDPFTVPAVRAYADACEATYPALAADLRTKAQIIAAVPGQISPETPVGPRDVVGGATPAELDALTSADTSRPAFTEEQARRGWFLAAAWARLAQARGGAMQAFDEDYEKTKRAREWLESIGVDVSADPPVVIPEVFRASRGEAPSSDPRAIKHDCGDAACPHHGRTSALGSMAPAVIAEASRAVHAPSAELLRERWIDAAGTAHTSNCSGQPDANGRCYCGAVQPLPAGLTCPGCYAETGVAQPHREAPPRCPGYAAHVTARPEDTSAPAPGPAPRCCSLAGEYNGYNSDGPRSFDCPSTCGCHD